MAGQSTLQYDPRNYNFIPKAIQGKQQLETFLLDFDLVFLIFLYGTAFERSQILKELERNFVHKNSFFKNYENWVYTMTPTDLRRFKVVLVKSLNEFRYEGGFSILHYLATSKLEESLEILVKDKIFDLNVKCNRGGTPLVWAKHLESTNAIKILTEAEKRNWMQN